MVETNDDEIEILRQSQASVVHCPESNMKLASGIAPVNTMVTNGVNVALGTDGHASNNDIDMFSEMRSASLLAKIDTHDPVSLPAEKAIEMATINGAQALHLNEKLGSLEIGKSADVIAVEANQLAMTPIYNPMSHLVYIANHANVSHVWVDGRCLLDNRVLTTFNVNQLHEEAFQWQRTIQTILAQVNSDQL
jgi:5-methylthioadenosine/S-adenosylhomocysteine deaminase